MKTWIDSKAFQRFLEIFPGLSVWIVILFPFVFAFTMPIVVTYFILIFNLYWFGKALNIARHLLNGLYHMKYNMRTKWYARCEAASEDLGGFLSKIEKEYRQLGTSFFKKLKHRDLKEEIEELSNLNGRQELVKDVSEIIHVAIIAFANESLEIVEPTVQAIYDSDYPSDKIIVVLAGEAQTKENVLSVLKEIHKKFDGKFMDLRHYLHEEKDGEVRGKGANITNAGKMFWEDFKDKKIDPENVLVTNLDSDHIVHREYFSRLTYKYIIDPDRDR